MLVVRKALAVTKTCLESEDPDGVEEPLKGLGGKLQSFADALRGLIAEGVEGVASCRGPRGVEELCVLSEAIREAGETSGQGLRLERHS